MAVAVVAVVAVVASAAALLVGQTGPVPRHTLHGELVLRGMYMADEDACGHLGESAAQSVTRLTRMLGGNDHTEPCPQGPRGRYSDIHNGTPVHVLDSHGRVLGVGALTDGTLYLKGISYTFTVPRVPEDTTYRIEVAHRGGPDVTLQKLRRDRWRTGLVLR